MFNMYIPKYDGKEDINVLINDWLRILLKFIVSIKMAVCIYIYHIFLNCILIVILSIFNDQFLWVLSLSETNP